MYGPVHRLSIEKDLDSVSINFQRVDPSSRQQYLLFSFGIDAIVLLLAIFLWSHWWARIFFPALVIYGIWGTFRQLGESQKVTLSRDSFTIVKLSRGRCVSTSKCKPWYLTNVRFRKRGRNAPSSIDCEVEGRFNRFAEGISESDAYSVLSVLLDSGFLPNDDEVHFW